MRGRYTYLRDIIYDVMPKVFGSPNNISHSSTCTEAEKFGSYYTKGYWNYSDGALAIAHVILAKGLWFKGFVGDFKDGMNRFSAGMEVNEDDFMEKESHGVVKWWNIAVKDMTPGRAAALTGVEEEQIVRVARTMAKAAPNVCVWMGPGAAIRPWRCTP